MEQRPLMVPEPGRSDQIVEYVVRL